MIEFDPKNVQPTGQGKRKIIDILKNRRWICKITPGEVNGMKEAIKLRNYKSWAYSIAEKYHLNRTKFEVDENTGDLYYRG